MNHCFINNEKYKNKKQFTKFVVIEGKAEITCRASKASQLPASKAGQVESYIHEFPYHGFFLNKYSLQNIIY